jgi:excisionase family DNA binding protein
MTEQSAFLREPLLDPEQAAFLLGIPRSSVYEYAKRGVLPYVKIGRHLKFIRADLERVLAERRIGV